MGLKEREDQKDETKGDRRRDSVEDEESQIEERKQNRLITTMDTSKKSF